MKCGMHWYGGWQCQSRTVLVMVTAGSRWHPPKGSRMRVSWTGNLQKCRQMQSIHKGWRSIAGWARRTEDSWREKFLLPSEDVIVGEGWGNPLGAMIFGRRLYQWPEEEGRADERERRTRAWPFSLSATTPSIGRTQPETRRQESVHGEHFPKQVEEWQAHLNRQTENIWHSDRAIATMVSTL